ncbi:hypothetical protein [Synechocystis salina]|nr:hypothetical protein [Synechocystis salina]
MQSPRAPRWNLSHWAIDHPRFTIGFWLAIAWRGYWPLVPSSMPCFQK